jgi:hypothetical protein|tara:strand:- start:125 stop:949 length:825 start_codon:yes stop_codon:yes gene_type:complete
LITLYNAIAGSCAEQEANAGGGGSPPAGISAPSQIYTALSNGGAVGIDVYMAGYNVPQFFINNSNPIKVTPLSGNASNNASMALTNQTLAGQPFSIMLEHTMPASAFNSLMNTGFTGGNPFGVLVPFIGFYLESPNGVASSLDYDILSMQSTLSTIFAGYAGNPANAPFNFNYVGNNWPLIDSTNFNNAELFTFFATASGITGGMGANGTLTTGNITQTQGETFSLVEIVNAAGRSGGSVNASAGQYVAVNYRFRATVGLVTEETLVVYRLALT